MSSFSPKTLLDNLLHTTHEAVCFFDTSFKLIDYNEAYVKAFGKVFGSTPRKDLTLDSLLDHDLAQLDEIKGYWKRTFAGETFRIRFRGGEKGGQTYDVLYAPLRNESRITGGLHIAREVTREEMLQEELNQTNRIITTFFDQSPLMMGIVETSETDILHISDNPASANFFESTQEWLKNRWASEIGIPDQAIDQWLYFYRKAQEQDGSAAFTYAHTKGDRTAWLKVTVTYLGYGFSGRPRFSYLVDDITRQKEEHSARLLTEKTHEDFQFQVLADSMTHLAWIANSDGQIYWFNQRWYEFTGRTLEEMQGYGWEKLQHPAHQEKVTAFLREAWKKPSPWELTFPLKSRTGDWRWFLTRAVPIENERGEIIRWFGTNTDITEEKRYQDELSYQGQLFKTVTDNAASSLFMTDKSGIPTFMNPAAEELTGYKFEEIKDQPLHYSVHYKRPDGSFYPIEECPIDSAHAEKKAVRNQEETFVDKAGRIFPVAYSLSPLEKNEEIVGSVIEFRDITAEKKRQNQLSELARLSLLLNKELELDEKFQIITDKSREIIGSHQAVLTLTSGQMWKQAINAISLSDKYQDQKSFMAPLDGTGIYAEVCRTNKAFRLTQEELVHHPLWKNFGEHRNDHPPMRGWLAIPLIRSDGSNLGLIQLSDKYEGEFDPEDENILTQLAQIASAAIENTQLLQREMNAVKARDEFLSIASHELKTPLTSLTINAQVMKKLILRRDPRAFQNDRVSAFVEQTEKQVSRLSRLVEDMLDISRIRTGKLTITKAPTELRELLTDVKQRFDSEFRIVTGRPLLLEMKENVIGAWDKLRIEQVINNLLTNALRYGRNKPVTISVRRAQTDVQIRVADQGIGIAPENREKIFDRFERAGISANEISGLGLGLYITKQIVLAHEGKIWVEGEPGLGSTFIVQLPVQPLEN